MASGENGEIMVFAMLLEGVQRLDEDIATNPAHQMEEDAVLERLNNPLNAAPNHVVYYKT